jgi:DNA invertase Pin-like site-specific DNA recombinase
MTPHRQHSRRAIYARTAAGGPAAIDAQVERCRASLRGDAPPAAVYRDVDVSGAGSPGPGLTALLADIDAGRIDHVVVDDWTRLGRTPERVARVEAIARHAGCRISVVEGRA